VFVFRAVQANFTVQLEGAYLDTRPPDGVPTRGATISSERYFLKYSGAPCGCQDNSQGAYLASTRDATTSPPRILPKM